jgi:hypothetical protein
MEAGSMPDFKSHRAQKRCASQVTKLPEVTDPRWNRTRPLQKANLTPITKSANAFLMSRIV